MLFFGEKWKFNQISFYSANRKSVLIKPKGNAKQSLEMEIVLTDSAWSLWRLLCADGTREGSLWLPFTQASGEDLGLQDKPSSQPASPPTSGSSALELKMRRKEGGPLLGTQTAL